jgi:hypothetical protein
MVILHGLIKMFKLELRLIIVLFLLLLPRFTLMLGFCCRVLYSVLREGALVIFWAFVAPRVLHHTTNAVVVVS